MGINASSPNARAYGISLIGCFRVVLYAHNRIRSLSTHLFLTNVSLFFRQPSNVFLVTSTWPLD